MKKMGKRFHPTTPLGWHFSGLQLSWVAVVRVAVVLGSDCPR